MGRAYTNLPDKKRYIEFFTALLSVPVMLTVIILNLNNLRGANKPAPQPQTKEVPIFITTQPDHNSDDRSQPVESNANTTTAQPSQECKKDIGPISIDYPQEGAIVNDNPLNIEINYEQGDYCSVVWAYRINGGPYSDYDNKSIALYSPPNGKIVFQLKVKSLVNNDEKVLTRTFTYQGGSTVPTPTDTSASQSAH